jgi:hypothetical protein
MAKRHTRWEWIGLSVGLWELKDPRGERAGFLFKEENGRWRVSWSPSAYDRARGKQAIRSVRTYALSEAAEVLAYSVGATRTFCAAGHVRREEAFRRFTSP